MNQIIKASIIIFALMLLIFLVQSTWGPDLHFCQPVRNTTLSLDSETTLGQLLPAEHCWSHRINIPIQSMDSTAIEDGAYWFRVAVYRAMDFSQPIGKPETINLSTRPDQIAVTINPDGDTDLQQDCFLLLQTNAPANTVGVGVSTENTLDEAHLFINEVSTDHDLVFDSYMRQDFRSMASAAMGSVVPTLQLFMLTFFLFALGAGVMLLIGQDKVFANVESPLAIFIGLACVLLFVVGISLLQLRFDTWMLIVLFGVIFASSIYVWRKKRSLIRETHSSKENLKEVLPLFLIFGGILFVRIYQSNNLLVPSWYDGLFHANILAGFLEKGGIPSQLGYHFGYHLLAFVNVKLFSWSNPQSLLLTGQWLSALLGLSLYYFVRKVWRKHRLALLSMLLFSLFSPFPAYLINWSRYSILLGSAFALILVSQACFHPPRWNSKDDFTIAVLLVGLILSHYTSILFAVFLFVGLMLPRWLKHSKKFKLKHPALSFTPAAILTLLIVCGAVLFLVLKGITFFQNGELLQILLDSRVLTSQYSLTHFWQLAAWNGGWIMLLFSLAGVVFMGLQNKTMLGRVWLWWGALLFFVGLQILLLQASQPTLMNVFIWAFIPLSISAAFALNQGLTRFEKRVPRVEAICLIVLLCIGFVISPAMLNPVTVLYSDADQQAAGWLAAHARPTDPVLVTADQFLSRQQPIDGGGWLQYLTDINIVYPSANELDHFVDWFEEADIHYIFVGTASSHYDLSLLPALEIVFQQDAVRIYEVTDNHP